MTPMKSIFQAWLYDWTGWRLLFRAVEYVFVVILVAALWPMTPIQGLAMAVCLGIVSACASAQERYKMESRT